MSPLELEWVALKSQRGEEAPLVPGLGGQFCRKLLVFGSPLEGARSSLHCRLISPGPTPHPNPMKLGLCRVRPGAHTASEYSQRVLMHRKQ